LTLEYKDLDELAMLYQEKHKDGGQLTRNEWKLIEVFLYSVFFEDEKPKYRIIKEDGAV